MEPKAWAILPLQKKALLFLQGLLYTSLAFSSDTVSPGCRRGLFIHCLGEDSEAQRKTPWPSAAGVQAFCCLPWPWVQTLCWTFALSLLLLSHPAHP